jgi:hypothetical protein
MVRPNQVFYNKFKSPDIIIVTKARRLEWLGHVATIDGDGTVKKLLEGKPRGRNKRARPKSRYV